MQLKSYYKVRFNDCDPLGHLNNSKYIDYMLNAREDHLKEFHDIELIHYHQLGKGWVVGNHEIFYLKPAFYNEDVCIVSTLIDLNESQIMVEMSMYDKKMEKLKCILWTRFISIDTKTGKKDNHSEDFMTIAKPLLDDSVNIKNGLQARIQNLLNLQEK